MDLKLSTKRSYSGIGLFTKSGYYGYSPLSKLSITIFNAILSPILLICAIPLFILIGLIIKLRDRGPIFYRGARLGYKKRQFTMYKFRTLPMGTQKKMGARLLSYKNGRLPFFSRFLRDTRLDELPQLFNILKEEMDFVGPRPLRPEIYNQMCKDIANYDTRFNVRPGLIGYSQLFTPHSSPKRIRAIIDNRMVYLKRHIFWDILMISATIVIVFKKICQMLFWFFCNNIIRSKVLRSYYEKRRLDRVKQKYAHVSIYSPIAKHKEDVDAILVDINEEYFQMKADKELDHKTYFFQLRKRLRRRGRVKRKSISCKGDIVKVFEVHEDRYKYACIVKLKPLTEFNGYMLDQYFLKKSIMRFFR